MESYYDIIYSFPVSSLYIIHNINYIIYIGPQQESMDLRFLISELLL